MHSLTNMYKELFFCCFLFERNAIFFIQKWRVRCLRFILFYSLFFMSFSLSLSLLQSDRRLSVQYTILLLKILGTLVKLVPHTRLWRAKRRIASSQFIMIRSHSAISLEYHLNYGWKQTHRCEWDGRAHAPILQMMLYKYLYVSLINWAFVFLCNNTTFFVGLFIRLVGWLILFFPYVCNRIIVWSHFNY